jgi:hypothetical protein
MPAYIGLCFSNWRFRFYRPEENLMSRWKTRVLRFAMMTGIVCNWSASAGAEVLITEDEALLPAAAPTELTRRGVTRAPKIEILSPASDMAVVKSPLNLKLRFESFGGSKIDLDTVKVIYLKSPAIDLTQRLKTHIKSDGIELDTAEVPPGDHRIKVEVKDNEGRSGISNFVLKVTK